MKSFLIFALIPLILSIGITPALPFDLIPEIDALKASGVSQRQYGSATAKIVCGDQLCSEVSGGYESWKEGQGKSSRVESSSVQVPVMKSKEMESTIEDSDPLLSWNSGTSKQKIIEFIKDVTNPSSSSFVPPIDRIATFDNDGTLWIEQPLYIPFEFHLEYLYEQLETEPNLASKNPYSELIEKKGTIVNVDLERIPGLSKILLTAYPNISQEDYLKKAKDFLDNTKHRRFDVSLNELTYKPMVELIQYLKQNNFQVYIVSAGFQGLMRSASEEIYDIEKENVIGTHPKFIFQITEQGPALIRQSSLASFNDGAEKPVNIQKQIGKIPIFACGNSGGDIEMLLLTHHHENHFACMLDHDDENREYYYPNQEALEESQRNSWTVISMKNDFKTIFSNSKLD